MLSRFLFGSFLLPALLADQDAAFARALGFGERAVYALNQWLFQHVARMGKRGGSKQVQCGNEAINDWVRIIFPFV